MKFNLKVSVFYLIPALWLGLSSCQENPEAAASADRLIARVYNKTLYLSDMEGFFPTGTTSEDSSLIINAYTERWVRDAVLLYEAERHIPQDLNIDKLVKDYKASLIKNNYEKVLVEAALDSAISQMELIDFYEQNKEKYTLEQTILRCTFIKTGLPVPDAAQLKKLWGSKEQSDRQGLTDYCRTFASACGLADSVWYTLDQLAAEIPLGKLEEIRQRYNQESVFSDDNYQYYVRILDWKDPSDIAPLEFVEEEARKVVLRKRITNLLEDKKDEMYERALKNKVIQLYLD
ncbi:MAG: hypothetical protein NWR67_12075 [Saprospiraceae bacterium]|nr:hypothetical protein [Saprospiraceae bacterium]